MADAFNNYQKVTWFLLAFCAFMVIPLSAGVVLLTQINRQGKQVSAQVPVVSKCDFNADDRADSRDVEIAITGFGKVEAAKNNLRFDVNPDGWVNSLDLAAIGASDPKFCR